MWPHTGETERGGVRGRGSKRECSRERKREREREREQKKEKEREREKTEKRERERDDRKERERERERESDFYVRIFRGYRIRLFHSSPENRSFNPNKHMIII